MTINLNRVIKTFFDVFSMIYPYAFGFVAIHIMTYGHSDTGQVP